MTFFMYGIFIGVAAATRRNDHLYLAVLAESMTGNRRLFFELFNRLVVLVRRVVHDLFRLSEFPRRLQKPAHAVDDADGDALYRHPDLRRPGCAVHHRADGERLAPWLSRPSAPHHEEQGAKRCDHQWRAHRPDGLPVPVPRLHGRAGGLRADRARCCW